MARARWCGDAIYTAVETFLSSCLVEDGSLFTPGEQIWTPSSVETAFARVGAEDLGSGSFIEKLEAQVAGMGNHQVQLGAELLYVLLLAELDTSGAKKREHLRRILASAPATGAIPAELDAALDAGGVANFAAAKSYRDFGLRFMARVASTIKAQDLQTRRTTISDPWALRAVVAEVRTSTDSMYAAGFLHLAHPEQFEYVISTSHQTKLIEAFAAAPGVADEPDRDRKISRIRELATSGSAREIGFYEDPLADIWKGPVTQGWKDVIHWSRRLFDRDDFDNVERDYKLEISVRMSEARTALAAGDAAWTDQLKRAFGGKNNITSFYAHGKFLTWCNENESGAGNLLTLLWETSDPTEGLQRFLDKLPDDAVKGSGTRLTITSFLLLGTDPYGQPLFLTKVYESFRRLLGLPVEGVPEIDPENVYRPDDLAARLGLDGLRVRNFLRRTYPRNDDEKGAAWYLSPEQAQSVLDEFAPDTDVAAPAGRYAEWTLLLEELRLRMLASGMPIRDILDAQSLVWWLTKSHVPEDWSETERAAFEAFRLGNPPTPPVPDPIVVPRKSAVLPAVTPELAKTLYLPQPWLEEMFELLAEKKQLILYGPPGTGKTFIAKTVGDHLRAAGGDARLVQFHPSYTYEDFFEGYRPKSQEGGTLAFELIPGALREIAAAAQENPSAPYLLIIDEINRGNIAKIFGELYFLLEYRNEGVRLQYSHTEEFRLPQNLFIVGTMNTADRSIALIDSALRRRFYFEALTPSTSPVKDVLPAWLAERGFSPEPGVILDELNHTLAEAEHAVGPSYFMPKDGNEPDLERIWRHAIMPLLEEYFYGSGRDLKAEFGLKALRIRLAKAADEAARTDEDSDAEA
jgi:hypothetical protein